MKKFFSLVLALVMALSLTTVAWGAVDNAPDLQVAFTAGGDVKLGGNITATSTLTVPAGVTVNLDLAGYDITGSGISHLIHIANTATLNISDSSSDKSGAVELTTTGNGSTVWVEGNLNLYSGSINFIDTTYSGISYAVEVQPTAWGTEYTEGTVFHMYGGSIYSDTYGLRVASYSSESYEKVSATFIMDGGEISSTWACVFVQQPNNVYDKLTVVINDGDVSNMYPDYYQSLQVHAPDAATDTVGDVETPTNINILGGDFEGPITVSNAVTSDMMDFAISGGTFSEAPPAEYVTDGLRYDSATGELTTMPTTGVGKYDLYDANGDLYKENITVEYVEAYDDEGAGNIDYYKLTYDGVTYTYFVECSRTKAECYLTLADNLGAYKHLKRVDYVDYVATGKAYTNIGDDCGELDVSAKAKAYVVTDEDGVKTYYVAATAGQKVIKVGNELVAVNEVVEGLVPHVWVVTAYNDKEEPATVKCKNCPATGKLYATKLAAPVGATFDDTQVAGYWVVVNGSAGTSTDKVQSADTFDAGIAMYVGMSVMAAAGSAVVIGKKKD